MPSRKKIFDSLVKIGPLFYGRGWILGTSGNFSAVLSRNPPRIAITAGGIDKGTLTSGQIQIIDEEGRGIGKTGYLPSSESLPHLVILQTTGAGAALHTHSIWATLLSEIHNKNSGFFLEGHEMLKGLSGVESHEHREWVPILANTQDRRQMSEEIRKLLVKQPALHGILIHKHGLYTWGKTLEEAKRHVEIFEFLFEAEGRLRQRQA